MAHCWAWSCSMAGRPPSEAGERAGKGRHLPTDPWHPALYAIDLRKTASASRRCWTARSASAAQCHRASLKTKRWSAQRSCASALRPASLLRAGRAGPWRSCAIRKAWNAISAPRFHVSGDSPASARPLSDRVPRRSMSMRCATARKCVLPASWSISRKPVVHSGDSACSIPPHSLPADTIAELRRETEALAKPSA